MRPFEVGQAVRLNPDYVDFSPRSWWGLHVEAIKAGLIEGCIIAGSATGYKVAFPGEAEKFWWQPRHLIHTGPKIRVQLPCDDETPQFTERYM
jgi:hypothetical protein